jgi:hypothetical protein
MQAAEESVITCGDLTADEGARPAAHEGDPSGCNAPVQTTPVRMVLPGVHCSRAVSALFADAYVDARGEWFLPCTLEAAISRLAELDARITASDRAWRSRS